MSQASPTRGPGMSTGIPRMRRHESDHEIPWALPVVVRRSKAAIAREIDILETVAEAVVRFLDDSRSQPGELWHGELAYWREGAIRKVVRRGDGKQFEDAKALGGVGVVHPAPLVGIEHLDSSATDVPQYGPAEAVVLPPGPVQPLPKALQKLQVGGTEFPAAGDSMLDPGDAVVTVEVTPLHKLTTGKAAAQVGHAAQLAYESEIMPAEVLQRWRQAGFRTRVVHPTRAQWSANPRPVSVVDAGFTELDGEHETTRAYW